MTSYIPAQPGWNQWSVVREQHNPDKWHLEPWPIIAWADPDGEGLEPVVACSDGVTHSTDMVPNTVIWPNNEKPSASLQASLYEYVLGPEWYDHLSESTWDEFVAHAGTRVVCEKRADEWAYVKEHLDRVVEESAHQYARRMKKGN